MHMFQRLRYVFSIAAVMSVVNLATAQILAG